jgi:thiol-disulfide isomerase/thioredoxin
MKTIIMLLLAVLLTGCSVFDLANPNAEPHMADAPPPIPTLPAVTALPTDVRAVSSLPDYGPAPEITNDIWLNTEVPLRLADLRGNVVLVDFWTYGCINCQHVIPSLRGWHTQYSAQGLVIIGVHYPEFEYEADLQNLRAAIVRLDVPYAVVQDNDAVIWTAYGNRFWPTLYLIDKQGHLRYRHIGEGSYAEIEENIQDLLAETYP